MCTLRKYCGGIFRGLRHRKRWLLLIVTWTGLVFLALSWSGEVRQALQPPPPPDQSLGHFRRSTDLKHYLDNIQVVIEPSSPCPNKDTPLLIMVTSSPSHWEQRQAIRATWGPLQQTYFLLGLEGERIDDSLADNFVEAKEHGDMVVYDMTDHYQNLTLKTALMLQWTLRHCPQAGHLFKTDDDVLVNPWRMREVVREHKEDILVGYRIAGTKLHRDEYTKWYVPRWLHLHDVVPEYLSGTGYLLHGKYLQTIFDAALTTPLMNLEDVYLTYLVTKKRLSYTLVHDSRLSPSKPWLRFSCGYWALASSHSYTPDEILDAWGEIKGIAQEDRPCEFYNLWL